MKFTRLFVAFLAAATMMFASCTKDEDGNKDNGNNGGNGGNNQPADEEVVADVNELVIDNNTYQLTVTPIDAMNFHCKDADAQHLIDGGIMHHFLDESFDVTWDLTGYLPDVHFGFSLSGVEFQLTYDNTGEKVMGQLDETGYDGESVFSEGTGQLRLDNRGFFVSINGKLKNGHSVSFQILVVPQEPVVVEAMPNTLVYNGTVYPLTSSYSLSQGGDGYIDAFANDMVPDTETPIFNIVSDLRGVESGTFDLIQDYGESVNYFFRLTSEVPFLPSFDQSFNDDGLHGSIGETEYETEPVFTSGTLTYEKNEDAVTFKVSGTMKSGDVVSFYLYMPVDEWEYLEW